MVGDGMDRERVRESKIGMYLCAMREWMCGYIYILGDKSLGHPWSEGCQAAPRLVAKRTGPRKSRLADMRGSKTFLLDASTTS